MIPAVQDWSGAILTSLAGAMTVFFAAIPKILAFAVILVVGWFVAGLIAKLVAGVLRRVRFDELAARSGFGGFVQNIGVDTDPAGFLANVAKWFIRLIVLVVAFDALGLPAVSQVLQQLLLWLPNLAVGLVVLVIGGLLANAAAGLVRGATTSAGFSNPNLIGNVARAAIWVFAIIVAVNQIGVADELVNTLFMGAIALAVIALGLAFGLGGREVAAKMVQRWYEKGKEGTAKMQHAAETASAATERRMQAERRIGQSGAAAAAAQGERRTGTDRRSVPWSGPAPSPV
jgi:hypothetical protein